MTRRARAYCFGLFTALGSVAVPFAAWATLIGDTVVIEHHAGSFGSVVPGYSFSIEVMAGTADETRILGYTLANPEHDSVLMRFDPPGQQKWGNSFGFNGLVIKNLDWSGPSGPYRLASALVETNYVAESPLEPGWDESRIIAGDDYIGFDWAGLLIRSDTYFNVSLVFAPVAIEEPNGLSAIAPAIIGAGLCAAFRRRLYRARAGLALQPGLQPNATGRVGMRQDGTGRRGAGTRTKPR